MSASPQSRVPAGVTTGGQYSTSARGEADVVNYAARRVVEAQGKVS